MDKCPRCGSDKMVDDGITIRFNCHTMVSCRSGSVNDGTICLHRQIAVADAEIEKWRLRANDSLESKLAAWKENKALREELAFYREIVCWMSGPRLKLPGGGEAMPVDTAKLEKLVEELKRLRELEGKTTVCPACWLPKSTCECNKGDEDG